MTLPDALAEQVRDPVGRRKALGAKWLLPASMQPRTIFTSAAPCGGNQSQRRRQNSISCWAAALPTLPLVAIHH